MEKTPLLLSLYYVKMVKLDIILIFESGGDNDDYINARLSKLYEHVITHGIRLLDVANEKDFRDIVTNENFHRFPQEERSLFALASDYQDFILDYDAIVSKRLPAYFLRGVVQFASTSMIGVQIQSSSDVAVQEVKFVDSQSYVDDLERSVDDISKYKDRVQAQAIALVNELRDAILQTKETVRLRVANFETAATFAVKFDPFIRSQMTFDRSAESEHRHLSDNLYRMYLTRETTRLRSDSLKRLPMHGPRGERIDIDNLFQMYRLDNFHDAVGRRFLILSTQKEFEQERRVFVEDVFTPLKATTQSPVILNRISEDFLESAYGYADIHADESPEYTRLYNDLFAMIQRYFEVFRLGFLAQENYKYIDRFISGGMMPLIYTVSTIPPIDNVTLADVKLFDALPSNRQDAADAYRRLIVEEKISKCRKNMFARLRTLYASSIDAEDRTPKSTFFPNDELLLQRLRSMTTVNRSVFRDRMNNAKNNDGTHAMRYMLMCKAQTEALINIWLSSGSFQGTTEFLSSKNGLLTRFGESLPQHNDYITDKSFTGYSPLVFVKNDMEPANAIAAVYLYHLVVVHFNLEKKQNGLQRYLRAVDNKETPNNGNIVSVVQQYEQSLYEKTGRSVWKGVSFNDLRAISTIVADDGGKLNVYSLLETTDALLYLERQRKTRESMSFGEITKETQQFVFSDRNNDNQEKTYIRFYRMFNILMELQRTPSVATVLLYMYLRFTETQRGIDSSLLDRTLETWLSMITHQNSMRAKPARIDESIDYETERHDLVSTGEAPSTVSFMKPILQTETPRRLHEYEGVWWCQHDIFMDVQHATTGDYLFNTLTLNNNLNSVVDVQTYLFEGIEEKQRRALLSLIVPEYAYTNFEAITWNNAKRFLWRLHPNNIVQDLLVALHTNTRKDVHAVKKSDNGDITNLIPRILALLKPIRNLSPQALDPEEWIRGVDYVNADQYLHTVNIKQIQIFDVMLAEFQKSLNSTASSSKFDDIARETKMGVLTTLNAYTIRLNESFFDIWMNIYSMDFMSSQIDRYIGLFYSAYNENVSTILPERISEDILPPSIVQVFRNQSSWNARNTNRIPRELGFDAENTYSVSTFLYLLALCCRASTVKDTPVVANFFQEYTVFLNLSEYNVVDQAYLTDVRNFIVLTLRLDVNAGDSSREFIADFFTLLLDLLGNSARHAALLNFSKKFHNQALRFAVGEATGIKEVTAQNAYILTHSAIPDIGVFKSRIDVYRGYTYTLNRTYLNIVKTQHTEYYYQKREIADFTKRYFTLSFNEKILTQFTTIIRAYQDKFIDTDVSLKEEFPRFLNENVEPGEVNTLLLQFGHLNDKQLVLRHLNDFFFLFQATKSVYDTLTGAVIRLLRHVASNGLSTTENALFLTQLAKARTLRTSMFYLHREHLSRSAPPSILNVIRAVRSSRSSSTGDLVQLIDVALTDVAYRATKTELDILIYAVRFGCAYQNSNAAVDSNARIQQPDKYMEDIELIRTNILREPTTIRMMNGLASIYQNVLGRKFDSRRQAIIVRLFNFIHNIASSYTFFSSFYTDPVFLKQLHDDEGFSEERFQRILCEKILVVFNRYVNEQLFLDSSRYPLQEEYLYGDTLLPYTLYRNTLERVHDEVNIYM